MCQGNHFKMSCFWILFGWFLFKVNIIWLSLIQIHSNSTKPSPYISITSWMKSEDSTRSLYRTFTYCKWSGLSVLKMGPGPMNFLHELNVRVSISQLVGYMIGCLKCLCKLTEAIQKIQREPGKNATFHAWPSINMYILWECIHLPFPFVFIIF